MTEHGGHALTAVLLTLVALKCFGLTNLSWWRVLAPLWAPLAAMAGLAVGVILLTAVIYIFDRK